MRSLGTLAFDAEDEVAAVVECIQYAHEGRLVRQGSTELSFRRSIWTQTPRKRHSLKAFRPFRGQAACHPDPVHAGRADRAQSHRTRMLRFDGELLQKRVVPDVHLERTTLS